MGNVKPEIEWLPCYTSGPEVKANVFDGALYKRIENIEERMERIERRIAKLEAKK